jgi:hypothetical protein
MRLALDFAVIVALEDIFIPRRPVRNERGS